jgi:hypothetical protein
LKGDLAMDEKWTYKNYHINDGLKPKSKHFQYFYVVKEGAEKKCHYCVWIVDEALSRFDKSKDFSAIVSSQKEVWNKWVKEKIDAGDFRSKVLKYEKCGEKEIELSEMTGYISMD